MATATRETWIDALKGWGMLLIVVGHVWSLSDVPIWYMWIFSFHVPLFFFAAGLTIKPDGALRTFIKRRAQTLLIPYFVFALLGYLFYVAGYFAAQAAGLKVAQFDYGLWQPFFGVFYGSVGDGLLVNSPLWFLPALFLSQILIHLLNARPLHGVVRYGVLLVLFAVAAHFEESINPPFSLLPALGAAIFIQWGLAFRQSNSMAQWTTGQRWISLAILFGITLYSPLNGAVGLAGPTINNPGLFILFALAGTFFSVLLVLNVPDTAQNTLAFIGRHSMGILVLHMLAIKGVKVMLSLLTGTQLDIMEHSLSWGLLILAIASVLMWPAIDFVERQLPWSLGNRR